MPFRHEWKHEISVCHLLVLRSRLAAVLEEDCHSINGSYDIRSLYFDSPTDKALQEKINGVNGREKFRLRCYNNDFSYLLLEKKSKIDDVCRKEKEEVTPEEVQGLLGMETCVMAETQKPLLQELYMKRKFEGLRPKIIVQYTREAFVYAPGNVRVTLDYNIQTGFYAAGFLDPDRVLVPAGERAIILEVKWDSFLPAIIQDLIQMPGMHTSAFSKYAACRVYG